MDARCRLCADIGEESIPIFDDLELPAKIFQLFQVKVDLEDRLPTFLCRICWEMIQDTWVNYLKVQKAQEILVELMNAITAAADEVDLGFPSSPKVIECVITNGTIELVKDDEDEDLDDKMIDSGSSPIELKPTKPRTRKQSLKKKELAEEEDGLSELSNVEFNEDGSVTPKQELYGWESYPWTCCHCQQTLATSEDLREHYATAHNQPPKYSCADCHKIYSKYSTFLSHVKLHRITLKFCCDVCSKWFPSLSAQEKHREAHGDERPHICINCGKRFRMQSALLVHARSHLPAELKNRYQCDQCPKRFGTKPNLMAHKRIHSGVRDYTCDQCGKSFVQKGNLDNHLLTHTAARPFSCSVCGKTFKTLVRLRKHSSVHSGLKPHQCDICGRQFRERGTLKEHHRIHTGAMPFTCEFCGKNFRFKGVLTTHRRQHTGERPYSCHECQHHFTNWPNYNKHMKRRHGINTSVTVRKPQAIPPTGMPHRNPPGTVLAPPQPIAIPDNFVEHQTTFFPVLGLYNISEDLLQQRVGI